jgi:hypothetical protein
VEARGKVSVSGLIGPGVWGFDLGETFVGRILLLPYSKQQHGFAISRTVILSVFG